MPESLPIATALTIIITVMVSLRGFKDDAFREKLIFDPHAILAFKEYHRLVSAALLHLDANHLFGNMLTLFLFGRSIEAVFGAEMFLVIYLVSIVGGDLLSLWLHRHHDYRALGASGGVCGILFAWILLFPGGGVGMFFIPISIPGWLYALGYLVYSFFALKHGWGNVGHDAHIGGAMMGLLLAAFLKPQAVVANPWLFAGMLTLGSVIFLYLWKNPLMLPLKSFLPGREARRPAKPAPGSGPSEAAVDAVLEKVSRAGLNSLTPKERSILQSAAKRK